MLRCLAINQRAFAARSRGFSSKLLRSSTSSQQDKTFYTPNWPISFSFAAAIAAVGLFTATFSNKNDNRSRSECEGATSSSNNAPSSPSGTKMTFSANGSDTFAYIVVGGGTAGCITAYLLAKWLENNGRSETVLLLDRGPPFSAAEGPSPVMDAWYDNWGSFGEAHTAFRADGSDYPVVPTTHNGVGGCGSHDTRISFLMREEQRNRVSSAMGWSSARCKMYFQAALDLIPLQPSMPEEEEFYSKLITSLSDKSFPHHYDRLPGNCYNTATPVIKTFGQPLMAMYTSEYLRTTMDFCLLNLTRRSSP